MNVFRECASPQQNHCLQHKCLDSNSNSEQSKSPEPKLLLRKNRASAIYITHACPIQQLGHKILGSIVHAHSHASSKRHLTADCFCCTFCQWTNELREHSIATTLPKRAAISLSAGERTGCHALANIPLSYTYSHTSSQKMLYNKRKHVIDQRVQFLPNQEAAVVLCLLAIVPAPITSTLVPTITPRPPSLVIRHPVQPIQR